MSTALYPTQLAPHDYPGALMAFRDGVFGRRPAAPYGQDQSAFQNGVLGPALGSTPALLDGGPATAYRDGIFNFPRSLQTQPYPTTAYDDGIFGGASLGQGAEAAAPVDEATPPPETIPNGNATPAPVANGAVTPLDLGDPATVTEVVAFMRAYGAAIDARVDVGGSGPKTEWDRDCSNLTIEIVQQMSTIDLALPASASTKTSGGLTYPTALFFLLLMDAAMWRGHRSDPGMYPIVEAFVFQCLGKAGTMPDPGTDQGRIDQLEQCCPVETPFPMMAAAAAGALGLAVIVGAVVLLKKR